jgi:hypothetical protein
MAQAARERLSVLESPFTELLISETPQPDDESLPLMMPAAEIAVCQPVVAVADPASAGRPGPIVVATAVPKIAVAAAIEPLLSREPLALPSLESPAALPPLSPPARREMIMISRTALYLQAMLFCLVAGIAFVAGYAAGRGSSAVVSQDGSPPPPAAETVAR